MGPTSPSEAMHQLLGHLAPVPSWATPLAQAAGQVLAQALVSDRPSPPADVSAMDGYAVRLSDIAGAPVGVRTLAVSAEVAIGRAPPDLPPGQALRIFTGGPVPPQAEAVIPRELVHELAGAIELPRDLKILPQQHIRRRGDNLGAGQTVVEAGQSITPAVAAALAAFGCAEPVVHRRLKVALIVTGNELLPVESAVLPWQLRDSNGPMLAALFAHVPWIEPPAFQHVPDDPERIQSALRLALESCDGVLLSGGVSMGDHDYVPAAVAGVGGRIVFHKLPIRPGRPMLGAVGPEGQAIFGLPGNPVSALTTGRRLASIALRKLAGFSVPDPPPPSVHLIDADNRSLPLWWYRPVKLVGPGQAQLVQTQGSGDLVSAARSDGIIEISPEEEGDRTHFPYYSWSLA